MRKVVPKDAILIPDKAKKVFGGVVFDAYQWQQQLFDGTDRTFEMLRRPDSISVLGIVDDKLIFLSEEQPHRGHKWTFPSGRAEPTDESTLATVQRELREEAGYEFNNWRLVNIIQPQVKLEWFVYMYVAWGVKSVNPPQAEPGEKITIELVDFDRAKEIVKKEKYYLMEAYELFERIGSVTDLQGLPEFEGKEVDR